MKRTLFRRTTAFIVSIAMLGAGLPSDGTVSLLDGLSIMSSAEEETVDATYIDATQVKQGAVNCKKVTSSTASMSEGWYAVTEDVTMNGRIEISGNVNLILCDNTTFTVSQGIGILKDASLTIWSQSSDNNTMGKVTAKGNINNAGIGGNSGVVSGKITINGGYIVATGGGNASGIGAGNGSASGYDSITINGGYIEATGGVYGAGIGGGRSNSTASDIIIQNATVTATGRYGGAGIGGGSSCQNGNITITGSTVTAEGQNAAAGIGSGSGASFCNTVTIDNSTVTATSYGCGAGIGSGISGDYKGELLISNSNVTATGGTSNNSGSFSIGGAGIGSGGQGDAKDGTVKIKDSIVKATGGTYAAGIGGGSESSSGLGGAGANVEIEITESTSRNAVIAQSGGGYSSPIGRGGSDDNFGKLTLGKDLKVYAGTETEPVLAEKRVENCQHGEIVTIQLCEHADNICQSNETSHWLYCTYCGKEYEHENHNNEESSHGCTVCGYGVDEITVHYVGEGNNNTSQVITITDENLLATPESLDFVAPEGKVFAGWEINGKLYQPNTKIPVVSYEEILVTAKWLDEYTITYAGNGGTITYNGDDGSVTDENSYTVKVTEGTVYTVPELTLKNENPEKEFKGWQMNDDPMLKPDSGYTFMPAENVTFKAIWETFTVTLNDGNGTEVIDDSRVIPDTDYILPESPFDVPEGKTFKCWKVGNTEYNAGDSITVTEDTVVMAVWEEACVINLANITLGGELKLNFYLTIPESIDLSNTKAVMDGPEGKQEILLSSLTKDSETNMYKVQYKIRAIYADKDITLKLTDNNGKTLALCKTNGEHVSDNEFTYGIYEYVKNAMSCDDSIVSQENKAKIKALYTYVAYSVKWKYGTELPNDGYINELPDIDASDLESYQLTKSGDAIVNITGASLLLDSNTAFKLYFECDSVPKITLNGKTVKPVKSGDTYYITVENIGVNSLKTEYTVVFGGEYTVEFCALSYSYAVLKNRTEYPKLISDNLCDLAKAIYAYSEAYSS